jgi:adenylate cyclase
MAKALRNDVRRARPLRRSAAVRPERHLRLSMVAVLALGFGALVAAAVASVLAVGLWSATRNTYDLLRDKAETAGEIMVMRTRRHLDPAMDQAAYLSPLFDSGDLDPADRGRLSDYLLAALAATPQVRTIALIDPDFDVLRVSRTPEGPVVGLVNWSNDPNVQLQMEEARARSKPYWGELVWSPAADSTLINLRAPLRRRDTFLGVLVSVVTVRDLSRFITMERGPAGANNFILYGSDYVLAHRSMARGEYKRSPRQPLPGLGDVGDPVLAQIWNGAKRSELPFDLQPPTRGHVIDVNGRPYIFLYRAIEAYGDVPWIVGSYFPEDTGLGRETRRLTIAGFGGLAILAVALAAAVVMGRRLSRPIRNLAEAAHGVSRFELATVRPLRHSRVREIDEAASAFNAMVGGLQWFETYVPRTLVRDLVRQGHDRDLRSEEREVTVLFTDITGFTALAEHKTAAEAAALLNEHFSLVASCVEREGGTIDKYIGDSVMAFWGAPVPVPDHAERACRAALAVRRAISLENEMRRERGEAPVRMRIGIHTGRAIAGNIGAPGRINYTLIGDTVNVAQRIEELIKTVAAPGAAVTIMVSGEVAAEVGGKFTMVPEGAHEIRGRKGEVQLFRLT